MMFRNALISLFLTSTALATTWTVDDDGLDFPKADFNNIQAAVDAASDGDEIVVMPGTYTGSGDEVVDMLGKAVWLHSSEGQEVTIIDGESMRRGIYCGNGETSNTIIEGFTITGGYANEGGGMYNYSSSPDISNCTFSDNSSVDHGGGMYNTSSSPTLENCTFTDNTAGNYGGGMSNYNSNPTLDNCTFTNNSATYSGGGMYNYNSNPQFDNCTFTNNSSYSGGGMYNNSSHPSLLLCDFSTNSATTGNGGGMRNFNSNPFVTNCTFTNNTATNGGGMINYSNSSPTLTGCTFTNNSATYSGGGMYSSISHTMTDTTVCGNTPDQINDDWTDNGGNCIAESCDDANGDGIPDECSPDCPADITGDGYVNVTDLLVVIDQWGLTDSPADLNFDGIVDVTDLLIVVGNWGACP